MTMNNLSMSDFTADEFAELIHDALSGGRVERAVALLKLMAVYHPEEAERCYRTLLLGISIAEGRKS